MDNVKLDFGAITIDNSILKSEGYKFNEGLLAQLRQFKNSPVQVLQTDIVHNEAIKHLELEISKARTMIKRSLRSANKQLNIKPNIINEVDKLLTVEGNNSDIAETRLNKFYSAVGAKKIESNDYVDISKILELYFSTKAPFEPGKNKKNEFPDAIALQSLEGWAERESVRIVAVSQDKGWERYSQTSKTIKVISSLSEALEKFQPHNKVANIIAQIREDSLLEDNNHLLTAIEQAIIESIDGYDVWIEASSYLHFEWDDTSAIYNSHELDTDEKGLVRITVISIDDESIILSIGATIEVEVQACFDFAVRDSVDKDYVDLGTSYNSTNETYHTEILVTLKGDFSQDFEDIEVDKITVLETIKHAEFGEVEPDWKNEFEE